MNQSFHRVPVDQLKNVTTRPLPKLFHGKAILVLALIALIMGIANSQPSAPNTATVRSVQYSRETRTNKNDKQPKIETARKTEEKDEDKEEKKEKIKLPPVADGYVRVAAVQFYSELAKPEKNRDRLVKVIRKAAELGAKVVVLPEQAINGYFNADEEVFWSKEKNPEGDTQDVAKVAEGPRGASFAVFSPLARELGIYITMPIIEKDGDALYNTVILLSPKGEIALKYRKTSLWEPGDTGWATAGKEKPKIIDTEYGRMGIVISYDMHSTLPILAKGKADIMLHCCALYGANFETFLMGAYTKTLRENGMSSILANWTTEGPWRPWWKGYGMSRIVNRQDNGKLARAREDVLPAIVIDDLRIKRPEKKQKQKQESQ